MFRSAIERAGLALRVECAAAARSRVRGPRRCGRRSCFNLLSNAFKHTLAGEIRVRVARRARRMPSLTVADTGVGIPPEALATVFDRFYRVPKAHGRERYEGSGIGLALVQELVKLHGGTIGVDERGRQGHGVHRVAAVRERAPARGRISSATRRDDRWVRSPRRHTSTKRSAGCRRRPPRRESAGSDGAADATRPTLCWSSTTTPTCANTCEGCCPRASTSSRPSTAPKRSRRSTRALPDLVLTDVMMPELDGFGLLKALRGDERTRDIPVVLLSARAGEESSIEGIDAGADDYLVKPFSARELHARVSSNLAMARARRKFSRAARENEARRSFLLTLSDALRAMSSTAAVSQCAVDHIGRQLRCHGCRLRRDRRGRDDAARDVAMACRRIGDPACCTDRPRPLRAGRHNTRRRADRHRRHAPARPCEGVDRRRCGRDHRRFASDRWPHGSDAVGQCSGIARVERRGSRAAA